MTMSYNKANDTIAMTMGGRVAEEIIFKDITSGASSDIQHATKLARAMVYDWGMSKKIGFLALGASSTVFIGRDYQSKNDFSEKLAGVADDEIMSILNSNYKRAKDVLTEKIEILHEMAKLLLARETIYKEEVDMVMAGKKTEEIVSFMEEKEKKQKQKEARIRAEKSRIEQLENFKKKIAEGENLVRMGIISQEELDNLKKEYEDFKKALDKAIEKDEKSEKTSSEAKKEVAEKDVKPVKVETKTGTKTTTSKPKTTKKVASNSKEEPKKTTKKKSDKNDEEI